MSGEILEGKVLVDKVLQLAGGKMRSHIVEAEAEAENDSGWCTTSLISCVSRRCGLCYICDCALMPSERRELREKVRLRVRLPG